MDIIDKIQEKYIQEFSENIPIDEFLINIIVTTLLVSILRLFYIYYGESIANRRKFANNFLPLALGTLLIIMIVKSSIALSLGLVGALSIVRYRAAIKDPEELTYLFIVIGIGLAGGANQPILAIVAFTAILAILFLGKKIGGNLAFQKSDQIFVNLHTELKDLNQVSAVLQKHFSFVQLKRMDTLESGLDLSYLCKADSIEQLNQFKDELLNLSESTRITIIDKPDLIV